MHVWAITHVRGMRTYTEPGTPCGLHGIAQSHAHTFKGLGLGCLFSDIDSETSGL